MLTNSAYLVKLYVARFRFGESLSDKIFSKVKEKKNYGFQFKTSK